MIRNITPIDTCVPWKPVIMKKLEPNWAAPQGLPQGRTPSMISLVHSKACMPTNEAPNAAVSSSRIKVLTAIRMRGIFLPQSVKANTSLGLGQGSVVDIRTVMYEIRNEVKMKVSLTRKIHIMALPQGTFLNARWSEDQSATMPCTPSASGRGSTVWVEIA